MFGVAKTVTSPVIRFGLRVSKRTHICIRKLSTSSDSSPIPNFGPALIHEVTPRDGLQNEKVILSTEEKLTLVEYLVRAKPASIELCSFVRPDLVPAMADGQELCSRLNDLEWAVRAQREGMHFAALVPNLRGYETFAKCKGVLDTIVCLVSCTDSHSKANVNRSLADALKNTCDLIRAAKKDGVRVQAYASLAFGCPFEGDVDPKVVENIFQHYIEAGADVFVLADTLGVGTPEQVKTLVKIASDTVKDLSKVGLHMHDAHGRASENVRTAVELGVRRFDSAVGGCGGCNFVPDADGNIATEDVLQVLDHMNISHGMDRRMVENANLHLQQCLGRSLIQFA